MRKHEITIEQLEGEKQVLEKDLGTALAKAKAVNGLVASLEQRNRDYQRDKDASAELVAGFESRVLELDTAKRIVEKKCLAAQKRGDDLQIHVDQLSSLKRSLDAQVLSLTESNDRLSTDNDTLTKKSADLEQRVEDLESRQTSLANEARDAKAKQQTTARELQRAKGDADTTKSQLEQETKRVSELAAKEFEADLTIKALRNDVSDSAEKQKLTDGKLKACSAELADISSRHRQEKARADDCTRG